MNRYPEGSVVRCRFAATLRPLTDTEQDAFLDGLGLPSGIGTTPERVLFDYRAPDGGRHTLTLTGGQVTVDGVGAFHVDLAATVAGPWEYRGYGQNSDQTPVFSTGKQMFTVVAF